MLTTNRIVMRQPMAGYSGTPLVKKLGIKPGARVAILTAAEGFLTETLGPLPDGVQPVTEWPSPTAQPLDFILAFSPARADVVRALETLQPLLDPHGMLWVAWPKKSSGVVTDVTENVVRDLALEYGLVDVKVCAIDETWSGLKLVVRLKDRPARVK